jgi:DNA-binding CsgD family transcriptional regulator
MTELPELGRAADGAALVGRAAELDLLRAAVAGQDGPAQLVEVAGDPGTGTTRLLGEFCAMAAAAGQVVLSGRATALGTAPFALLLDALGPAERLAGVSLRELSLAGPGPVPCDAAGQAGAGVARQRLYQAGVVVLELAGAERGAAVILDEVHLADDGSAGFVDYLVRHPPAVPFELALGYRPRQLPPPLSRALGQLSPMARTRLVLRPLPAARAAALLPGAGPARCAALHEASGGNLHYLHALRQASEAAPWLSLRDPEAVFEHFRLAVLPGAVHGELAALPPDAAVVASAAALAGDRFDAELVAEAGAISGSHALAGLAGLIARDLIRPAGPPWFRYRHPLLRAAAYQLAGAGWRTRAHGRAARVLERRCAPAALRAAHVAASVAGGADGGAAVGVLTRAAESVQATQPDRAAHWLGVAAGRLTARAGDGGQRAELLLRRARALAASGQLGDGRELAREALRLLDGEPAGCRLPAVLACAAAERMLGHYDAAARLLAAELDGLAADRGGQPAATLRAELALVAVRQGSFDAARELSRLAVRTLARADRDRLGAETAAMFAVHAVADSQAGCQVSARRDLRSAAAALDGLPDERAATALTLFTEVTRAELALGQDADAVRHAARGAALAARHGRGQLHAELSLLSAVAQVRLGLLDDAAGSAQDAAEAAARLGSQELRHCATACQAAIALWRGDGRAGLSLALAAAAGGALPGDYLWRGYGQAVLGWAWLANGAPAAQVRQVLTAGGPGLPGFPVPRRPAVYDLLVQAELGAGDVPAARRWADLAGAAAAGLGLPGATGCALLARARVALAAGQAGPAIAAARDAAAAFAGLGWRGAEGQARHLLGSGLAAAGLAGQAQQEWGRAKELFGACGARQLRAGVLNSQRRLAARLPRRRRAAGGGAAGGGPAGLTAREREIVGMVTAGRTNRQIAERLFLSTKTIETHLTHIFAKLGVTSRSAVAGLFAQLDKPAP